MDTPKLLDSVKLQGWYLTEAGLKKLVDAIRTEDTRKLTKEAINWDLKEIGGGALPTKIDYNTFLKGNIVLQIQKIRNLAAPKCNEQSTSSPRFLQCELTDGINYVQSLELERITELNLNLPPGTKIHFKADRIQVMHGFLLLKPQDIYILGGWIESLVEKWEMARRMQKFSYNSTRVNVGGLNDPPPWLPFGKRIDTQLNGDPNNIGNQANKDKTAIVSSTSSSVSSSSKGNAEFNNMRNEAIAEAARVGGKKTFGGGQHNIIDHNVKKILAKGYTEEQAKNALRMTNFVLERALYNLKRQSGGNGVSSTSTSNSTTITCSTAAGSNNNTRNRSGQAAGGEAKKIGNRERSHGRKHRGGGGRNTTSVNEQGNDRDQSKPATNVSLFDFLTPKLSTNTSNVTTANGTNTTTMTSTTTTQQQQQQQPKTNNNNFNQNNNNNCSNVNADTNINSNYDKGKSSALKQNLAQQSKSNNQLSATGNKFENNMSVSFAATRSNSNQTGRSSNNEEMDGNYNQKNNTNNNCNNEQQRRKIIHSQKIDNQKTEDSHRKDRNYENNISSSSTRKQQNQRQRHNNSNSRSAQRSSTRSFRVSYRRNNESSDPESHRQSSLDHFNNFDTDDKVVHNMKSASINQKSSVNKISLSSDYVQFDSDTLSRNTDDGSNKYEIVTENMTTTPRTIDNYTARHQLSTTSSNLLPTTNNGSSNNTFINYNLGKAKPTAFVSPLSKSLTPYDPNKILGFQTKEANEYAISILRSQGLSVAGYANTAQPTTSSVSTSTSAPSMSTVSTSTTTTQQVSVGSQTNTTSINLDPVINQHEYHQTVTSTVTQTDLTNEQILVNESLNNNSSFIMNNNNKEQNAIYEEEMLHSMEYNEIPETNRNCNWIWRKGDICLARYWEDDKFYEAEITDITENTCVVLFMDYGNYEEVLKSDCVPLTANIYDAKLRRNMVNDLNNERRVVALSTDLNNALSSMVLTSSEEGSASSIELVDGEREDRTISNQRTMDNNNGIQYNNVNSSLNDCLQTSSEPFRRNTRNHNNSNAVNTQRYRNERQVYVPPYKRSNRQSIKRPL